VLTSGSSCQERLLLKIVYSIAEMRSPIPVQSNARRAASRMQVVTAPGQVLQHITNVDKGENDLHPALNHHRHTKQIKHPG